MRGRETLGVLGIGAFAVVCYAGCPPFWLSWATSRSLVCSAADCWPRF